jgi:YidC/Oxa1 family membrane protein insertase
VDYTNIRIVAFVLIVIMCITTFTTQKQIQRRSGPVEGQAATVQKLLLYGMPLSLFVSGFFFPIGVLLYWFTNNLWTLGQQFYILRRMPVKTPTGAEKKPTIDPKLLAPKPGAKPLHPKNRRTQAAVGDGTAPVDGTAASDTAAETGTSNGASAAPGGAAKATPSKPGAARSGTAKSGGTVSGGTAGSADGARRTGSANGSSAAKRTPAKSGGGRPKSGKKRRR